MDDPLTLVSTRQTPQSQRAASQQVRNSAGGYTFAVDDLARLRRFLVLGVDGGTFYVQATELTEDNAQVVIDLARTRTAELAGEIVALSTEGRAPKQNPALFALAAAAALGDETGRRTALDALPLVARTGTHLFLFARYVEQFRGWGRGLRRAVANWYLDKTVDDLAYQAVKYRQREGWGHRDLLRLAHPQSDEDARRRLFDWICGRSVDVDGLRMVEGFQRAQSAAAADIPALIAEYPLSWEMLPDEALTQPEVWAALLDKGLPQTALLRQLPRLTRLGLLDPLGSHTAKVADPERLRAGRVHPISVLVAQRTYASGQGGARLADLVAIPADRGRARLGVLRGLRFRAGVRKAAHARPGRVRLDGRADQRHADHLPRGECGVGVGHGGHRTGLRDRRLHRGPLPVTPGHQPSAAVDQPSAAVGRRDPGPCPTCRSAGPTAHCR